MKQNNAKCKSVSSKVDIEKDLFEEIKLNLESWCHLKELDLENS